MSAPYQLTIGQPQGSPFSQVLFNVHTKGLADLNQNGPSKIDLVQAASLVRDSINKSLSTPLSLSTQFKSWKLEQETKYPVSQKTFMRSRSTGE